jgi:2-polyprenyl-6-methoxyphenol hydroxylase-like FAD-dependent oxidoreductase
MQNAWRHYESWRGELPGFIALGDAVCGFNPVYGQGMSSAARCTAVLERCLVDADPRSAQFPRRFFREQAEFLTVPWTMAVSRDREQARMEGDAPTAQRRLGLLLRRLAAFYMGNVALAAADDDALNTALFEIINLSRPPADLFRDPRLVARVLRTRLRQLLRRRPIDEDQIPDHPPGEIAA